MNILEIITDTKKKEIAEIRNLVSEEKLMQNTLFGRNCNSLKNSLLRKDGFGIIAEFKRKSPSKGEIHPEASVEEISRGYTDAGAAGLSVLTNSSYFGGSLSDLVAARMVNPGIPILRKDFIIDPYQVTEAKAHGADVILLIAACLGREEIHLLAEKAKSLGMEVLLEIHGAGEMDKISQLVDIVGVNNRDLKTFTISMETSVMLSSAIPERFVKISESGISSPETIKRLKDTGFSGFLIGEYFMKTGNPAEACKKMIQQLNHLRS